ncbi:hypothetical protein AJ87_26635 [Rhizobium yanglingense]|nr:hypothetical protein AJ87_26635 [Rhizobium yanglingense]
MGIRPFDIAATAPAAGGLTISPVKTSSPSLSTDDDAYRLFCTFRWSTNGGQPFCPKCGNTEPYSIRRRRFRCFDGDCMREFSVTSGTVFHSRKLSFRKLIVAIWEGVTAVKGVAALHLTRKLGVEDKTAWVLLVKIKDAIGKRRAKVKLWGSVQIDGKYVVCLVLDPLTDEILLRKLASENRFSVSRRSSRTPRRTFRPFRRSVTRRSGVRDRHQSRSRCTKFKWQGSRQVWLGNLRVLFHLCAPLTNSPL